MSWLFPGFLAGAALIGLPVILHLLRRRPREVVAFPSLRFLGESAVRDTHRSRLLRRLTLLLRCLAIALLCAAFARPFWGRPAAATRSALVIALDNSMSQQARGRWDETQRWALSQLDALRPGDEAALLVMEPEPVWAVRLTSDLERVRSALLAVKPGYEKTRYARPLRLAGEALAGTAAETRTIAWAADEQRAGWRGTDFAQTLPPGVSFRLLDPMPVPQRQAAIVSVRHSEADKPGLEVTIRQYQPGPDRRTVTVYADKRSIASEDVSLVEGDNKVNIACAWPRDVAGLRVALDADDLPADDSAWMVSAQPDTNVVRLDAISETDFVAHALRATEKIDGAACEPAPLPDRPWPINSAVVLRNEASFRDAALARLGEFSRAGGALWIFVDGSAAQKKWLEEHGVRAAKRTAGAEPWHLRDWDAGHPALAAFNHQSLLPLLEIEFYQGFDLSGDALAPVANWPDGKAALAEADIGGQRLFIAGFPLDREATDWPTRPSFVPFVHGAVRWLATFREEHSDWRVGDTIPLPANEGVWRPLDTAAPEKTVAVQGSVRPETPGLYEFAGADGRKIFAVNTPLEESDLSPWPNRNQLAALESPAAPPANVHAASIPPREWERAENRQRLWWWLLLAGGCALLAELALANRTSP